MEDMKKDIFWEREKVKGLFFGTHEDDDVKRGFYWEEEIIKFQFLLSWYSCQELHEEKPDGYSWEKVLISWIEMYIGW